MNRRSFLSTAGAASAALAVPTLITGRAFAGTLPTLSASAVNGAKSAALNLAKKLQASKASGTDIQALATAFSILFGNMQETGWNTAFKPMLVSGLQGLISSGKDNSQHIRAVLAANGISISSSQAEQLFNPGVSYWRSFLSTIEGESLETYESGLVTALSKVAKSVESQGIHNLAGEPGQAHLRRVGEHIGFCFFAATEMGVLALITPPPFDAVFGIAGLIYGVLDAMNGCGNL